MTPSMWIFSGTPQQQAGLALLAAQWSGDFWMAADIIKALEIPGTTLLFVGREEDWEGMLLGREDGADAELFYIFVDPKSRGRGLGRALFEAWRSAMGARAVHLEVRPSRREALALYGALGFRVVRTRRNYYADGEDALIMKWEQT